MTGPGTAGDPRTWPPHIRDRYGVRDRRRWVPWALALALVCAVAAVTVVGWQRVDAPVRSALSSYSVLADDHMRLAFEVERREPVEVTCTLRARASDGYDVGYATVTLPPARGRTAHVYELRTAYRGLAGELLGCGVGGPATGIAPAQFRPGVTPPDQPWTATSD